MSLHVSLILPTYNERENIIPLILEIHQCLSAWTHEIIVVDDQSPDGTYQLVADAGFPFVRPLLREGERGLAKAIRHGIDHAQGENVVVMDSDFSHQPQELSLLVSALGRYECALATRFLHGGRGMNPTRHLLSHAFSIFVNTLVGGTASDVLFGFFAMRRSALRRVNLGKIFYGHGDYYMRLLNEIQQQKISFLEVPAIHNPRRAGWSKGNLLRIFVLYTEAAFKLAAGTRTAQARAFLRRVKGEKKDSLG